MTPGGTTTTLSRKATLGDTLRRAGATLACALWCANAYAVFTVTEAWVRPAGAKAATEAYMELSSSEGATIIAVRCAIAAEVSLVDPKGHPMKIALLALPAGETVTLMPGAVRVALTRLAHTLRLSERVPLVLVIRDLDGRTQEIAVDAEVRRRSPTDGHLRPRTHH
jgi:copper(I)-binding protein